MGILNVTPDSFSDGGFFVQEAAMAERIEALLAAGVDVIDVGGESTRPGAAPVNAEEELARTIPAIRLIRRIDSHIPISIDTAKATVARAALEAGATMLNDITALQDQAMLAVAMEFEGPVCIMHMQGTPRTMQIHPEYGDVLAEISNFFRERLTYLETRGVARSRIILDPGIGFGKTLEHNLTILRHIATFRVLGCPVLIGHSRKSFLGKLLGLDNPVQRDPATAVLSALCALHGVDWLRVHDVALTRQALLLAQAVSGPVA